MKSHKFIDWEPGFKLGWSVYRPLPVKFNVKSYARDAFIGYDDIFGYEVITWTERKNVAPKFLDKGVSYANEHWKYYTFKVLPGAIIFLGTK